MDMESICQEVRGQLSHIDVFCAPTKEKALELQRLLKKLFELSVALKPKKDLGSLEELYVTNLDVESIWEQVQSRNRPMKRYIEQSIKQLIQTTKENDKNNDVVDNNSDDDDNDDESESDAEPSVLSQDDESYDLNVEESDVQSVESSGDEDTDSKMKKNEDNVSDSDSDSGDMENWLDAMDEAESRRLESLNKKEGLGQDDDSDSGDDDEEDAEDDQAYVERVLYDLDSENDGSDAEGEVEQANEIRFEDFFGSKKASKTRLVDKKRVTDDGEVVEDSGDDRDEEEDEDEEGNSDHDSDRESNEEGGEHSPETNTKYARRKKALQEQIEQLERDAVGEKSWEVSGEVKSSQRPENSLLGLPVHVERSSKIAPVINQEHLKTIEDMILHRIKDANFDNIVFEPPKHKTAPVAEREDPNLSQEKSHLGLGEIYAEQFLKQSANFDAKATKDEEDANLMIAHFQKVCRQLDALSHFQYAPKPVGSQLDSSAAAVQSISLEDVAPTTMLHAEESSTSKAPEQVAGKKRGFEARFLEGEEASREDRQRARRRQRKRKKAAAGESSKDDFADIRRDARVVQQKPSSRSSESFSNSKDFFSKMQNEASNDIQRKLANSNKPSKSTEGSHSASLKL